MPVYIIYATGGKVSNSSARVFTRHTRQAVMAAPGGAFVKLSLDKMAQCAGLQAAAAGGSCGSLRAGDCAALLALQKAAPKCLAKVAPKDLCGWEAKYSFTDAEKKRYTVAGRRN